MQDVYISKDTFDFLSKNKSGYVIDTKKIKIGSILKVYSGNSPSKFIKIKMIQRHKLENYQSLLKFFKLNKSLIEPNTLKLLTLEETSIEEKEQIFKERFEGNDVYIVLVKKIED